MPAAPYDILIEQGVTFRLALTLRTADGTRIDLTGCAARMQIRPKVQDPQILYSLTTENGGLTINDQSDPDEKGRIYLYISDEDTASFTWRNAKYDLELAQPSGDVQRLLKGSVTNDYEVTR